MNQKKHLLALIVFILIFRMGWAQNNLSVTNRSVVNFDMSVIMNAGNHTEIIVDDTQWVNYSFNVNPSDPPASITVAIASGNIPPGMEIYIQAGNTNGLGHGKTGQPTGKIRVDHVPMVLINNIGTSNTGNGKHKGHQLSLSIVITDYSLLQPGDYTLYFEYTLKQ